MFLLEMYLEAKPTRWLFVKEIILIPPPPQWKIPKYAADIEVHKYCIKI